MFEPVIKADQLILGNPSSPTAIVCLWTPRERVAQHLDPEDYAAIGQLYSARRGLEFLIRNLLANPSITDLVITGSDRSGSGIALRDLFTKGVSLKVRGDGTQYWKVLSTVDAELDGIIPKEALVALQNTVTISTTPIKELSDHFEVWRDYTDKIIGTRVKRPTWLFDSTPPTRQRSWPVPSIGQTFRGDKIEEVWVRLLNHVMTRGTLSGTHYGSQQLEVLNLVSVVEGSEPPFEKEFIPEWLPVTADQLEDYIPTVVGEEKSDGDVKYTYADRIRHHFGRNQVRDVVQKLVRDQDSRSAVVSLWDANRDNLLSGSPCLNHIWFRLRDHTLFMAATIRSNDMFSAWPLNAYSLRHLQWLVLEEIGVELDNLGRQVPVLGPMTIVSESAHIYDDCWDAAEGVVEEHLAEIAWKQHKKFADPNGSFIITTDDAPVPRLLLQHLTPGDGNVLQDFTGEGVDEAKKWLIEQDIQLDTDHALYLGEELDRVDAYLEPGAWHRYKQDT